MTWSTPVFIFRLARTPSSSRFPETGSPKTLGSPRLKKSKTFLLKSYLKQPHLVAEIPNLTIISSFPPLDLLRLSVWQTCIAASDPGKRWVQTVSVATIDPALGLSSRQDRSKTPVSSSYRAIGPKQITGVHPERGNHQHFLKDKGSPPHSCLKPQILHTSNKCNIF
jgi:hypothetical protein